MIGNQHKISRREIKVYAACRIGEQKLSGTHHTHKTGGQHHLFHGVALVIMNPALHDYHRNLIHIAENKPSFVSGYGGHWEAFNFPVADLSPDINALRVIAQT